MDEGIRMFVLQKHSPQSHTYVGDLRPAPNTPPTETVESLTETVCGYIKSRPEFKSWGEDVDDIGFAVHQLPRGTRKPTKRQLVEMANGDKLNNTLPSSTVLETLRDSPGLIFVFDSLQFRFVLLQTIGSSRECLAVERATALPIQNVHVIKQAAQNYVNFHLSSTLEANLQVWEPRDPFKLEDELTAGSKKELRDFINGGYMDECYERQSSRALEDITHKEHLIITFETLRFNFVMFEQKSKSSYESFGPGSVAASPEDLAQTIYDTARSLITGSLNAEDLWTVATIDNLFLYEVNGEEDYKKVLDTGELESGLLRRGSSTIRNAENKLGNIGTSNLIFVFAATRKRPLRIPYALFYRESGSYQCVGENHVDASSGDTVEFLHGDIHAHIRTIPPYNEETGHEIIVYEPKEAFESAYDKQPNELKSLKLEKESFSDGNCSVLLPLNKLSDWRVGQALIIVFGIPVQPQPSPISTSILDRLRHLHIGEEAPSVAAKLENYTKTQKDAKRRILDDRPEKDNLIAPIPLLFQPFGYFRDIRCGVKVPGEQDIREDKLRGKVDALADAMTLFHKSEEERSSKFLSHLEEIFDVPEGSICSSKIPGVQTISDGHINGKHGAMVFCMECKNELSAASCEPTVQLVSYIAHSLKNRGDPHSELFQRWRVPVLGATHIGPNVQFFGVVWMGQMRAVPLTPSLPMVDPTGEEFRWDLFLAFKAASIVFSKIRTDVHDFIQVLKGPPTGWPPVVTTETCRFPGVTEIDVEIDAFPNSQMKKIKFVLESRYDNVEHRHLYHARLVSPTSPDKAIYVKFSQSYSVDLHRFCVSRKLAPKILGFQQLSGGWFVVAMEKIDIVDPRSITSFPEAERWKADIGTLVDGFHQENLVHGDLRLANFVFTKSENPRRMLLVDFDWGGKEGEVVFPHELLNEELGVSNHRLRDRKIEKEHDRRCLLRVFQWLDHRIPANPVREVGVDIMESD